jgi:hypothetical protein
LTPALSRKVDQAIDKFRKNTSAVGLNVEELHSGWFSFRVNDSIRVVVHRERDRFSLAHVDTHDAAYRWANRHRFRRDPDGIAISEVKPEVSNDGTITRASHGRESRAPLFAHYSSEYLISLGVPTHLLQHVQNAIFDREEIIDVFPSADDVSENLIDLSEGKVPKCLLDSGARRNCLGPSNLAS